MQTQGETIDYGKQRRTLGELISIQKTLSQAPIMPLFQPRFAHVQRTSEVQPYCPPDLALRLPIAVLQGIMRPVSGPYRGMSGWRRDGRVVAGGGLIKSGAGRQLMKEWLGYEQANGSG